MITSLGLIEMNTSIQVSKLGKRFDVKYHTSKNKQDYDSVSLRELKETIVRDPNCYGFKYSKIGNPIVRISDMKQPFIDFSRVALISDEVHSTFHKTQLKPFDILISVRGMSTGKVSIFLGEFEKVNISPNVIIVRLKDITLSPYITMVLISTIGQRQIHQFLSGGGKPSLTAPMVNDIKIPLPSTEQLEQINLLFNDAVSKRKNSKLILNEVNSIFDDEFKDIDLELSLTTSKVIKNLHTRWDAHFHNVAFYNLRMYLSKNINNCKNIEDYGLELKESIKDLNAKDKIEYIEISSVNNLTGIIDSPKLNYPGLLPKSSKIEVENGTILISKVRPYLNANTIIIKKSLSTRTVVSKNAFTVFDTSMSHYKYYLSAFLRSKVGLCQIEMYQSGTSYPTVSSQDIKKIKIIQMNNKKMNLINTLYEEYLNIKLVEDFTTETILELIQDQESNK